MKLNPRYHASACMMMLVVNRDTPHLLTDFRTKTPPTDIGLPSLAEHQKTRIPIHFDSNVNFQDSHSLQAACP